MKENNKKIVKMPAFEMTVEQAAHLLDSLKDCHKAYRKDLHEKKELIAHVKDGSPFRVDLESGMECDKVSIAGVEVVAKLMLDALHEQGLFEASMRVHDHDEPGAVSVPAETTAAQVAAAFVESLSAALKARGMDAKVELMKADSVDDARAQIMRSMEDARLAKKEAEKPDEGMKVQITEE